MLMSLMKISTEETLLNSVSIAFIVISTFVLLPIRHGIDGRFTIVLLFLFAGVLLILRSRSVNFRLLDSFLARMRASVAWGAFVHRQKALTPLLIYSFAFLLLVFRVWRMGDSVELDELSHLELTKSVAAFDLESWIETFTVKTGLNPPLPYFSMAILLRPFDFSLLAGRVILCLWAALIPVVLFYMLHELCGESTTAISASLAYTLSTLYQGAMFKYDFDALSTLFFTLSVYSFVVAVKRKKRSYLGYSMIAWILLILTKYPPAGWLFLGFILTGLLHREVRSQLGFVLLALLIALLIVVAVSPAQLGIIAGYFARWRPPDMEYAIPLFRDFAVILGWSPYLAFVFKLGVVKKTRDPTSTLSVVLIVLAFISPIFNPLTRRVIQAIPLLAATLVDFSMRRWSRTTSLLMLMNFCWWGVIKLPYL